MNGREVVETERDRTLKKIRDLEAKRQTPVWNGIDVQALEDARRHLVDLEGSLAALDTAESQRRSVEAQNALAAAQMNAAAIQAKATEALADAQLQVAASQRDLAEAQAAETLRQNRDRADDENANFWLRRGLTSLAIANAVGLASTIAAATRPESIGIVSNDVASIANAYFIGMLLAGLMPFALSAGLRSNRSAETADFATIVTLIAMIGSAVAFFWAGVTMIGFLRGLTAN